MINKSITIGDLIHQSDSAVNQLKMSEIDLKDQQSADRFKSLEQKFDLVSELAHIKVQIPLYL